jgi:predicted alpha/beta-hydrolase family hydrolase
MPAALSGASEASAGAPPAGARTGRGAGTLLSGPLGGLIARPWFDPVALWSITRWLFPLSRAWAAATVAEGSLERFRDELPAARLARRLERPLRAALEDVAERQAVLDAAERAWDEVFFDPSGPEPGTLAAAQRRRARASDALMQSRFAFARLVLRHGVPAVRFAIPDRVTVEDRYATMKAGAEDFHALPDRLPPVSQSQAIIGPFGREYWVRFESPNPFVPGLAWAHVFEPLEADPARMPTLIEVHGVAVETESLSGWDDLGLLAARGVRVVRLSAPWHNRRRLPGRYGGEPFFAGQPASGLDMFRSLMRELAVLVGWARSRGHGRVAIGGTSMGALAGQLAASHAVNWPAALRPDLLYLVTTSADMAELSFDSSLSRALGLPRALTAAGWTRDDMARWSWLLEPLSTVAVAPRDIVMLLGRRDTVTPYRSGLALARTWRVPEENLFCRTQGHFSASLGLLRDPAPYERLVQRLLRT